MASEVNLKTELVEQGGTLLAEFAGVGNIAGVRNLLDCGVSPSSLYKEGDSYFDIAKDGTALHVASWRGWPDVVKELIARGAPVNAADGKGRTALALAVKACVDSHWTMRRSPIQCEPCSMLVRPSPTLSCLPVMTKWIRCSVNTPGEHRPSWSGGQRSGRACQP